MKSEKFDVVKCIAYGAFSVVYEIAYPEGDSKISNTKWALKRFYLKNQFAVWCALREHNIHVRLARAKQQSPFLCCLLQSLRLRGGPAFVLRKGSGFDLSDPISNVGFLRKKEAKFYSCEIICGLEHLHAMHIVPLDLSLENVLLAD
ncbi:Ribosomal protein S6 kinase beta [Taenia solium]|eukprot:TsM_000079600 transcript=TsM_000079600 gene=TsM_000079600